jgi:drug/metabolite transporter (DMT)-like permease
MFHGLAAVVLFGGVAGPLFLMLGLARTEAASGSLLLNLEGLFTMGLAWLVFRENVDRRLLLELVRCLPGPWCSPGMGMGSSSTLALG